MELGKIEQIELREIWQHEALNFTKWLAETENLDLLSEEIDIELSLIDTEYSVGRFNVDIFAEETNTGRKVIIENQLEKTDHDHLGKLITYASGLEAEVIIWVVKEVLEEHQQAIEWLNENTQEKINFFAIKMEVWKINDSLPAPKFHIIAKPNGWAKEIKTKIQENTLTETKALQLKFWNQFKTYVQNNDIPLNLRKTNPQHWYNMSMGRSDCQIALTINSQKKEFGCEIYIANSKETFYEFEKQKDEINNQLGELEWYELPTKKASRIKLVIKGDFTEKSSWEEYFSQLAQTAVQFKTVFSKY